MSLGRSGSLCITNAHVLTMDAARPTARAVVIHDGIITYVGSDEGARTEDRGVDVRIDADGRTVIPGFNDAHGHFVHEGLMQGRLDLSDAKSIDDAYRRIRSYLAAHPDMAMPVAERWDESNWPERRFPTKQELDAIEAERPLLVRRVDGHVAVANSALLRLYDERWDGDASLIDHATGLLLEAPALEYSDLFPTPRDELSGAIDRFIQAAWRHGVTSGQDFANPHYWRAWQDKKRERDRDGADLGLRLDVATYVEHLDAFLRAGITTGMGDDWLAMGGVKIFADGSYGAHTAYLQEPYDDADTRGVPTFDDETLVDLVRRAHDGGLQHRMHVIGDAAVEQGTRAFEQVAEAVGLDAFRAMRHRFEHYELSTPDQRRRAKSLGVVLSMQPNFVGAWATDTGLYGDRLGARHRRTNPLATILAEGVPIAFGSDTMPFGPMIGLRGAVAAPYPEMRLDLHQAISAYTYGSAYAQHREHVKGMIRPGMLGDLALFNKDLSIEDPHDAACLDGLAVRTTVVDGHVVYDGT